MSFRNLRWGFDSLWRHTLGLGFDKPEGCDTIAAMLSVENLHALHPEISIPDIQLLFFFKESEPSAYTALQILSQTEANTYIQGENYKVVERAVTKIKGMNQLNQELETGEFQPVTDADVIRLESKPERYAHEVETDTADFKVAALSDRLTIEEIESNEARIAFNELTLDEKWATLFGDVFRTLTTEEQNRLTTVIKTCLGFLMKESILFCNHESNDERYFTLIKQLENTEVQFVTDCLKTLGSPRKQDYLATILTVVSMQMKISLHSTFDEDLSALASDLFDNVPDKTIGQVLTQHSNH